MKTVPTRPAATREPSRSKTSSSPADPVRAEALRRARSVRRRAMKMLEEVEANRAKCLEFIAESDAIIEANR